MRFNIKVVFTKVELLIVYGEINKKFKELPIDEMNDVLEEIETHNGLFIKSGYDDFEFSHLTIQEYFVANYIVMTGNILRFNYSDLLKIPNELAIAVALSYEPSKFFYDLLVGIMFKHHIDQTFFNIFFNRIKLEKPDFESNIVPIITLLTVYSKICVTMIESSKNDLISSSDSVKLFEFKDEFEKAIVNMFGNDIAATLHGYYILDNQQHYKKSNLNLLVFTKLKTVEEKIGNYGFPKYLYWIKDKIDIKK